MNKIIDESEKYERVSKVKSCDCVSKGLDTLDLYVKKDLFEKVAFELIWK